MMKKKMMETNPSSFSYLKTYLADCKSNHEKIDEKIQTLLIEYNDDGKEPNPIAKGMSWFKTHMKLAVNESDFTIADLIITKNEEIS